MTYFRAGLQNLFLICSSPPRLLLQIWGGGLAGYLDHANKLKASLAMRMIGRLSCETCEHFCCPSHLGNMSSESTGISKAFRFKTSQKPSEEEERLLPSSHKWMEKKTIEHGRHNSSEKYEENFSEVLQPHPLGTFLRRPSQKSS